MLKRAFALSDQGAGDLNKGIAATTLSNLCQIIPTSLLIMLIMELLGIITGEKTRFEKNIPLYCVLTVVLFVVVFAT